MRLRNQAIALTAFGVVILLLAYNFPLPAQAIALTAFGVVMAAAAFEDFRRFVIPNLLPIMLCALWAVYFAAALNVLM